MISTNTDFETCLFLVIRAQRKKLKLTQKEVASVLCMSKANYSKFENNQYPASFNKVIKLAEVLGIKFSELIEIAQFTQKYYSSSLQQNPEMLDLFLINTIEQKQLKSA